MSSRYDCARPALRARGLDAAARTVADEGLVVLPTDTVYGLGCDAFSPSAVASLLAAKGRGRAMPPPVLIPAARTLDGIATDISGQARALAEAFWPGALTLVLRSQPTLDWDLGDTHGTVAVRMPLHPVALELLSRTGPLAVSSANLTGSPAATDCDAAQAMLGEAVAVYLDAGPSGAGVASTIVDCTQVVPRVLRAGALSVDQLREVVVEITDGEPVS